MLLQPPKTGGGCIHTKKGKHPNVAKHMQYGGKTDVKLRTNPLICKTLILILQKLFPLHLPHSTHPFHLLLLSTFNFPLCRDAAVCYYKTTNRLVTNSCQVLVWANHSQSAEHKCELPAPCWSRTTHQAAYLHTHPFFSPIVAWNLLSPQNNLLQKHLLVNCSSLMLIKRK